MPEEAARESAEKVTRELSIGEIVTRTFNLYRRDFTKYLILFLLMETTIGIIETLLRLAANRSTLSTSPTPQQALGIFEGEVLTVILSLFLSWIFAPIAYGGLTKIASDRIQGQDPASLSAVIRYTTSRIVSFWLVTLLAGVTIAAGFVALIVPGIVLWLMFSLVIPVVVIENRGVIGSLGRSRSLVRGRWGKAFGLQLVIGIVSFIPALLVDLIGARFGIFSSLASSILSSFYIPLVPIAFTVFYYSNVSRLNPPPPPPPPPGMAQEGAKSYCPACGSPVASDVSFCPNCGARLSESVGATLGKLS